jgi:predicted ATP-grasp superfamily ATP-dependent carboligase
MTSSRNVPALVLGDGYTALAAVRALGRAGVNVLVAAAATGFAGRSRFVRRRISGVEETADGILEAARVLAVEQAAIIPCSDLWCEAVVSLPAETRERLVTSLPPGNVVSALQDKAALAHLLRRRNVPHPRTVVLRGPADLAAMDGESTSWLLKPRSSQRFYRAFGRKGFVVRTRREAESRLAACTDAGLAMVLQEYLPGPAGAHVLIDGFQDRTGIARARLARRRVRKFPPDLGDSTSGIFISLDEVAEPLRSLDDLLAGLRFRGLASAEFKLDPRDGTYKLLEINCRPFGHFEAALLWGTNLCLMAYRDALGLPLPAVVTPPAGAQYGHVVADALALLGQYRRRELSMRGLAAGLAGAIRLPAYRDDPLPAAFHVAEYVRAHYGREDRAPSRQAPRPAG